MAYGMATEKLHRGAETAIMGLATGMLIGCGCGSENIEGIDGGTVDAPELLDGGPPIVQIGRDCETDEDCEGGTCLDVGERHACTSSCEIEENDCLVGWTCTDLPEHDSPLCACIPVAEICDEGDNDCDGAIDENVITGDPTTLDSAQYEAHWYAGDFVIDWRTETPSVHCGAGGWAFEGSSTWSDPDTGDLRYYSNGLSVWNADGELVPNGGSLAGNMTATETSFFAPVPGSGLTRMFVFVNDTEQVFVSVLDMESGEVETEGLNTLVASNTGEAIGGVDDLAGGFWLVLLNGASMDSYHIVDARIPDAPEVSSSFPVEVSASSRATIRFDRARDRIAVATESPAGHWWADFDASSGSVVGEWHEIDRLQGYSIDFSPDGKYIYFAASDGTYGWSANELWRHDTGSGETEVIATGRFSAVALAPDGNIYTGPYNGTTLSRVFNPDAAGGVFEADALSLGTCRVGYNLSKQLFLPTAVGCTSDSECDDGNRCTEDECDLESRACVHSCTACVPF